jgi:drug/metabolite transporter (DMT)-like permease
VLAAAFAHAGWNFLAKGAGGGAAFVWLFSLCSALLLSPLVAVDALAGGGLDLSLGDVGLMAGSGVLHAWYFVSLQRAYRDGDLSFVYPLARGVGPLLATVAAIVLLDERPSALALLGGAMIVGAVLSIAIGRAGWREQGAAPLFALVTGVSIAAYTLWDKHAVDVAGQTPEVYLWGTMLTEVLLLSPVVIWGDPARRPPWRAELPRAFAVGGLSALAYVLVLYALRRAPVSYVAPAREVSIVVGAALGVGVLSEADGARRLAAAGAIVAGLAALALG